jgi:hypothetical protein
VCVHELLSQSRLNDRMGYVKKCNAYKENNHCLMLHCVLQYEYNVSVYLIVISMKKIRKYSEHSDSCKIACTGVHMKNLEIYTLSKFIY